MSYPGHIANHDALLFAGLDAYQGEDDGDAEGSDDYDGFDAADIDDGDVFDPWCNQ